MVTGFNHSGVVVDDLDAMIAFYTDVLGLEVLREVESIAPPGGDHTGIPNARRSLYSLGNLVTSTSWNLSTTMTRNRVRGIYIIISLEHLTYVLILMTLKVYIQSSQHKAYGSLPNQSSAKPLKGSVSA